MAIAPIPANLDNPKSTVQPNASTANALGVSPPIPDSAKAMPGSTTPATPATPPPVTPTKQAQSWWDIHRGDAVTGKLFGLDGPFEYDGMGAHSGTPENNPGDDQHDVVPLAPNTDTKTAAAAIIRREEGFDASGKYDVNAYRGGYGSDTYTKADGTVVKITKGMPVSKDDAERDVQRRIPILNALAAKQIGPAWSKLPGYAQGVLIATADNYGHVPAAVVAAAQSGNTERLANAVEALGADNGGIRRARYHRGANIIRGIGLQAGK